MSLDTAIMTNIIATFLMVFAYSYLYLQYRHAYLAKWAAAFIILAFRQLFLDSLLFKSPLSGLIVTCLLLSSIYSLLLVSGTVDFAGRRLSRWWFAAAFIVFIDSSAAAFDHLPFQLCALFEVIFIGAAYIATGWMFWNADIRGAGKYLTGGAFILLGIHNFDMLLLFPVVWFAPLGFLIEGLLKFVVAFGIILVFFEKAKNELEKYYQLLAENTVDVVYRYKFTEPAGFEYISPAVKQLTGYEAGDFKSIRDILHVIHPEDRRRISELFGVLSNTGGYVSFRLRHKNGELVWAEQKSSLFFNSDGKPASMDGIVRDVTKRVLLEQDVARLDRLNIAGQMAANLAHEVRNPLTTVRGYLQLMGTRQEFQHFKGQFIMLLEELDRTNGIITEYLSLSKDKMVDIKRRSLNDIISAIYPLIQTDAAASNIEVRLNLANPPEIFLDDKEIKQLLLNLTRNAIAAMPDGGLLEIETAADDAEVSLTVRDQGPGIAQEVLQNLGKPFLTTKEGGTGLGLAICYRIVSRHNAKLSIATGQSGTAISIRFRKR